jgi:hypothetical protein
LQLLRSRINRFVFEDNLLHQETLVTGAGAFMVQVGLLFRW